jgi:hypothetical protein
VSHEIVERLSRPTPEQLERCIDAHRPVIFTGLMDGQTATTSWDVPYLRARLGARPVKVVEQAEDPRLFWDPEKGLPLKAMPFQAFAAGLEGGRTGFSYLQDQIENLAGLRDDYRLPAMMEAKQILRAKFWLSGHGLITPLHYDPVETLHWVVRGRKRFVCYAPGVRHYYPFPFGSTAPFISRVDPDRPRPGEFPRFERALPVAFHLEPGEILYLPAYWWHQVYSQGAVNVSVNFVWHASRWKQARHLPQYLRSRRHVARATAAARAAQANAS